MSNYVIPPSDTPRCSICKWWTRESQKWGSCRKSTPWTVTNRPFAEGSVAQVFERHATTNRFDHCLAFVWRECS